MQVSAGKKSARTSQEMWYSSTGHGDLLLRMVSGEVLAENLETRNSPSLLSWTIMVALGLVPRIMSMSVFGRMILVALEIAK